MPAELLAAPLTPEALRTLERSLAYERARGALDSFCGAGRDAFSDRNWYDLDDVDEDAVNVDDEAAYLDSRGLLERHPTKPRWVDVRDESEATA